MPIKKNLKILIIDNYDSFTYNLFHMIPKDIPSHIIRNDQMTLGEIRFQDYSHIIISPGPGSPDDPAYFGVCSDVILELGQTIPLLGICLGMQGICYYFGGKVVRAKNKMHGKTSLKLQPGAAMAKSWLCSTKLYQSMEFNSIQNLLRLNLVVN
jgi:anthranilate synthase component II